MSRSLHLTIASATDTGRIRAANEDALWTGDSVFAVADGMGGHAAGEVASATALEPVADLDGKVFANARDAREALAAAVLAANRAVVAKADADPSFRGMGTTLTAAMFEGRRLHVAHVGDSRAYLLRNGELSQLTTDHTLVQRLIDEGELTPEEAAEHPHRSVITRAIGVGDDVEVDSLTISLMGDDQLLLCSDGLTGPVSDAEIARCVLGEPDAEAATDALVHAANAAGGPDNITVVLLRFGADEAEAEAVPGDHTGILQPAHGPIVVRADEHVPSPDWAKGLGRLGALEEPEDSGGGVSTLQRATAVAVAVAMLVLLTVFGGRWLLSRSYYVGAEGTSVAIFQGVPAHLGPLELSWVSEVTDLTLDKVPDFFRRRLREGIPATDLQDARRIVESAPRTSETTPPGGSADPSATSTDPAATSTDPAATSTDPP